MDPARILVVEDERIVAMDIATTLERLGYAVAGHAPTGEDALRMASHTHPDLVLMDINLGSGMDGVEAAGRIRSQLDIPVVYLTAYTDETTLERAKVTEPYGYIIKPFEERELHTNIEVGLYKHRVESELRRQEAWRRMLLASMADAVLAVNTEGRIGYVNPCAEKMLGAPANRLIDKPVGTLLAGPTNRQPREVVATWVARTLADGEERTFTDCFLRRSSGAVPVRGTVASLRDGRGRMEGVVVVLHDMSTRVEAQQLREEVASLRAQLQKRVLELV